jgi:hypothetical protein
MWAMSTGLDLASRHDGNTDEVRVYLRVAKRLVQEPHLPRPLRWLLVFALLPIPGPIDEAALALAALTIALFYRPRFVALLAEEREKGSAPD